MANALDTGTVLAELRRVEKVYGNGVVALRGVDLTLATGEVHAIVGENGAGKSTLVKILFGLEQPTAGEVLLAGRAVTKHNPSAAMEAHIGMVHQHFQLIDSLSAAENLVLGSEPRRGVLFDRRAAADAFRTASEQLELDMDPDVPVGALNVGDRQRLEILKALHRGAKILILDEPTGVLTPQEADRLLESIRNLAAAGTGVVLITHKLREVMTAADRVSVLRGGQMVWTKPIDELDTERITGAMMGGAVPAPVQSSKLAPGRVALTLSSIATGGEGRGHLHNIDMQVRSGEIVGIAGVEGNGQDDLVDVVSGLRPAAAGRVELDGTDITELSVKERRSLGLAHIAADRMHRGAALAASIADNVIADRVSKAPFSARRLLQRSAATDAAQHAIDTYAIRTSGPDAEVQSLSGGNIQKVVVARELAGAPVAVLAVHPTRGVDVGAMAAIHRALLDRRAAGAAVVLVSSELDELRRLSDRLVVLYDGRIVASFDDPASVDDATIGAAMTGAI